MEKPAAARKNEEAIQEGEKAMVNWALFSIMSKIERGARV